MEEKIKHITARFLKIPAENITALTPIGRTAVESSILIHRMYAMLAQEGMPIADYTNIETFGQLLSRLSLFGENSAVSTDPGLRSAPALQNTFDPASRQPAVGIDIESVDALPVVSDFREDHFYQRNFSDREIAHCILQNQPLVSFAGLFAAKEALIKAGLTGFTNGLGAIEIIHTGEGRPLYPGFTLSIAHTDQVAVAIALPAIIASSGPIVQVDDRALRTSLPLPQLILVTVAVLMSLAALVIACIKA